jgi:putative DNA primase/helicase
MSFASKHLSEAERARIARELYTVKGQPDGKGNLHGLCPFHDEKNPSFAYNFIKDQFNCLSCGAAGDLIKLWAHVHCPGADEKEAFKQFCEAHGISGGEPKPEDPEAQKRRAMLKLMREAWQSFPSLPEAMLAKLQKERGWDPETIKKLDLRLETKRVSKKTGALEDVKKLEKIAIPIFDEKNNLVNIRLYHPGAKEFKIISFAEGLGASRLLPAQPHADGLIVLCEGESDTLCALSHGLNAITQTSKLREWPEGHKKHFKGRDVVIAYDADEPGQKYAYHAAQSLIGTAKSVRLLAWPEYMLEGGKIAPKHGQDLTDFFVRHGKTRADFDTLAQAAPLYDLSTDPYKEKPRVEADEGAPVSYRDFFARGVNDRLSFKPRLLAERIITDLRLLSDPETGLIFKWNGKIWEVFDEDHVRKIAVEHLGDESQKSRAEDAVYQVKMLSTITHGRRLNDREDWICIQNGMLNVATFEMASHDPDFLSTYALPVSLDPEAPNRCARWEEFTRQTIQTDGPINQAQEFAGYCLTRHTKYEKCLFLLGPGEDGKSTFLKILQELVGKENCAAVSFSDLENEFHRSSLFHKLLNISTEIGATAIDSPYFKAITSGDTINAAFKHKNNFEFQPYCKLAFAGNQLPRVRDNSHGYFRRFLPIKFKHQFREGDPERDPFLFDKLTGELSEIFFWALHGLKRLTEQKMFTMCDETKELMMDYRRTNNPVLCFVEDECTVGADKEADKNILYESYREYCKKFGYMALNKDNFFRELYAAVNNLALYRPTVAGVRQYYVKGITLGVSDER